MASGPSRRPPRSPVDRRTAARRTNGLRAEEFVAAHLRAAGWTILARRVRVGRDELDLVALEPGSPPTIVVVEVRSHASSRFGAPEESVDRAKIARLYRAAGRLMAEGMPPAGGRLPGRRWRVDLVAVEIGPALGPGTGGWRLRHLRSLGPD